MTVPANKDELLQSIDISFDKLIRELCSVPMSMLGECDLEGHSKGTQVSVANACGRVRKWTKANGREQKSRTLSQRRDC
ncbi:ClbS/DfsB family four-helix bundle protein [Allorhizobium terrae]|uniref:ClbS/DfsB family four-helix bundle protein n=1 Tax=Allorhizobium terrae TaxID=1848972 RepID=A0A4S4A248_9HYPH|nr:ClbS/DfsB family four-helix bundle protein [Allorhizobium terrae]